MSRRSRDRFLVAVACIAATIALVGAASAPAIYHGDEVKHAPPWLAQVRLAGTKLGESHCAGELIRSRWILTAAHCVTTDKGSKRDVTELEVYLGRDTLSPKGGERRGVVDIRVPREFKRTDPFQNDVALLKLHRASTREQVGLLPLGESARLAPGGTGTVLGWGEASRLPGSSDELLSGVNVLSKPSRCDHWFRQRGVKAFNADTTLCVFPDKNLVDPAKGQICAGDSGGPLFYTDKHGHAKLLGITSFWPAYYGLVKCGARAAPTGFARVGDGKLRDWVLQQIRGAQRGPRACPKPITPPSAFPVVTHLSALNTTCSVATKVGTWIQTWFAHTGSGTPPAVGPVSGKTFKCTYREVDSHHDGVANFSHFATRCTAGAAVVEMWLTS